MPAAQAAPTDKPLTEEEKRKIRAAKFGTAHLPETDKKKLRAERFGLAPAAAAAAAKPVWKPAGVVKPSAPIPLAKVCFCVVDIVFLVSACVGTTHYTKLPVDDSALAAKPRMPHQAMSVEELERRKARAAKYGTAPPTQAEEEAAKRLARAVKYGTVDEATKRAMRAQRFNGGKEEVKGAPPAKRPRPEGQAV